MRGGPAPSLLARAPGSRHKPVRLAGPLPPDAPLMTLLTLSQRGKAAAAASLPAGLSEQAAPRLLRVSAEPRHNQTAPIRLGNPKSLLRRSPTAVKVVATAFTLISSSARYCFPFFASHTHPHAPPQGLSPGVQIHRLLPRSHRHLACRGSSDSAPGAGFWPSRKCPSPGLLPGPGQ